MMGRETGTTAPKTASEPRTALQALIEQTLTRHPGVREAAVTPDGAGAVVVLDEMYGPLEIREDLRADLLAAGHPADPAVLSVSTLPTGRPDSVGELAAELGEFASLSRYEPAGTELEAALADRLAELLALPRVGALDDFVDLGGDSLTAVRFLTALQAEFGAAVSVVELFAAGTVRELARLLAERALPADRPA
ncbi:phosphopantetheine-binding protein [Kitasatospora sp. NPDC002227]|uniref:phosphopantetheine-binding protein n=1 Tax=Kitasatospora sp. NPDC002227 TaxID=3154773 RepID=UPI003326E14F